MAPAHASRREIRPQVREEATCEVLDYSNWARTDSDQYGTTITQLVGGRELSYEYGKLSPSDAIAQCDVQVNAVTSAILYPGPFGLFGQRKLEVWPWYCGRHEPARDWIDCTT